LGVDLGGVFFEIPHVPSDYRADGVERLYHPLDSYFIGRVRDGSISFGELSPPSENHRAETVALESMTAGAGVNALVTVEGNVVRAEEADGFREQIRMAEVIEAEIERLRNEGMPEGQIGAEIRRLVDQGS